MRPDTPCSVSHRNSRCGSWPRDGNGWPLLENKRRWYMGARYGTREKERERGTAKNKELPRANGRALSPLLDLAFRCIGLGKTNGNSLETHEAADWEENRDRIGASVNNP